jgi:hypothetical protein
MNVSRNLTVGVLTLAIGATGGLALTKVMAGWTPSPAKAPASPSPSAEPSPNPPRASVRDLDCDPGELIGGLITEASMVGRGEMGFPASPEAALGRELQDYPQLKASMFRRTNESNGRVQLTYERNGRRLAQAAASQFRDGWIVGMITMCSSVQGPPPDADIPVHHAPRG